MEFEKYLEDLIMLVEIAAPKLWGIAVKQVYVSTVGWALVFFAFLLFAFLLFKLSKTIKSESRKINDTEDVLSFAFQGVAYVVCVLSLIPIYEIAGRIINPEYYAIELLLNYVN